MHESQLGAVGCLPLIITETDLCRSETCVYMYLLVFMYISFILLELDLLFVCFFFFNE